MQGALSGNYKSALVQVNQEKWNSDTGIIDFIFEGEGGVFTNMMEFMIKKPEIKFYQKNMALVAKDDKGAEIGFSVEGLDLERIKIELKIKGGSSYCASYIQAETEMHEPIPGTYFAILGDINEEEGEPGTYAIHTLEVRAHDEKYSAIGTFEIYRVTTGLNVGTRFLNCYRALKKTSIGKDADDLTAADFDISYTKVPVTILKVDENAHEIFHVPAFPEIKVVPYDAEDSIMQDRLDRIGLEIMPVEMKEGCTDYVFRCTKGWLEPPLRADVRLIARVTEEEDGEEKEYICDKAVTLLSQPIREKVTPDMLETDRSVRQWIDNTQELILSVPGLYDEMGCEYLLLNEMWHGYDEKFGYDPVLVAQLQKNVEHAVYRNNMSSLMDRQRKLEQIQESANADNNLWTIWSKSFAMVSDSYVDTWGGIAARIALAVGTGGLSETLVFVPLDVNKAVNAYNERTLLCDRTLKNKLIEGSIPVFVEVLTAGTFKAVGAGVKAVTPPAVKAGLRNWAINATKATVRKIPEKWVFASQNLYSKFRSIADKINSYDPRRRMLGIRQAAATADSANTAARTIARKNAIAIRSGTRTIKGKAMSTIQRAGELNGAMKVDRFKKAVDRVTFDKSPAAMKELKESLMAVNNDTFALNALNFDGKTGAQIADKAMVSNKYRAAYNLYRDKLVEDPALKLMTKRAAAKAGVTEDKIVIKRVSGKTAAAKKEGFTISYDADNSPMYYDKTTGKAKYFRQADAEEIVGTSYCDVTNTPYSNTKEAVKAGERMKKVAVTMESPEAYKEVGTFKTTAAFSDEAIEANMVTGKYKMTHEYTIMDKNVDSMLADTVKTERILRECEQFTNREVKELSNEALEAVGYLEKEMECGHQVPKTYDLYVGKDILAQSYGYRSGFSESSRVTVETCRLAENQGMYHIDLGELHDWFASSGKSYQQAVNDMVLDFKTVNTNCRAANQTASSYLWNMSPGSAADGTLHGLSGAAGSVANED
jgi:hypothetical protein